MRCCKNRCLDLGGSGYGNCSVEGYPRGAGMARGFRRALLGCLTIGLLSTGWDPGELGSNGSTAERRVVAAEPVVAKSELADAFRYRRLGIHRGKRSRRMLA
jgi:hypothetical protein